MIVMLPVMQLMLFGYAINTTPRHLPTAVLLQEDSDLGRSILKRWKTLPICLHPQSAHCRGVSTTCCCRQVLSASKFPAASNARCGAAITPHCSSRPTPPIPWRLPRRCRRSASSPDRAGARSVRRRSMSPPFEIRAHARYNPAGSSRLNIVPGLVGTILTMTMLIFTALS